MVRWITKAAADIAAAIAVVCTLAFFAAPLVGGIAGLIVGIITEDTFKGVCIDTTIGVATGLVAWIFGIIIAAA